MSIKKALLAILVFAAYTKLKPATDGRLLRRAPSFIEPASSKENDATARIIYCKPQKKVRFTQEPAIPLRPALGTITIAELKKAPLMTITEARDAIRIKKGIDPKDLFNLYRFFNIYYETVVMTDLTTRHHKEKTIEVALGGKRTEEISIQTTSRLEFATRHMESHESLKSLHDELLLLVDVANTIEPLLKDIVSGRDLTMPIEAIEEQFLCKKNTIILLYKKAKKMCQSSGIISE